LQAILDDWCEKQKVVSWSGEVKEKVKVSEVIEYHNWHKDLNKHTKTNELKDEK